MKRRRFRLTGNHTFDEAFALLKEYLEINNQIYPETYYGKYKDIYLGQLISKYRATFFNGTKLKDGSIKYNSCTLTKEQIDKLNSIKFVWVGNYRNFYRRDFTINKRYGAVKDFLEEDFNRYIEESNSANQKEIVDGYIKILNKRVS